MQDKRPQDQQDQQNNEKQADKNKTLDSAASNVVDYGRSEQKAIEESREEKNSNTNLERSQDQ